MSQDPSLFEIKNGNLILLGKPSTDPAKDKSKYITGGVSTKDKKYFEKGRLEIRCKLEATQGAWPAIWMTPDAPWPTGGEIDIVERLNYEPFVHHTVHSTYTQAGKKDPTKRTPKSTATAPPYMLRIDMQLGGSWVGEVKPFTKPVRMYVDWVRFYQK